MIAVRAHIRVRRKQAAPAMRSHQPGTLPSRWVATGRTRQNRSWATGGRYV
jgi:glutaconyl-CoA/methylmalonyl-CoA decarboxylase subunit delta